MASLVVGGGLAFYAVSRGADYRGLLEQPAIKAVALGLQQLLWFGILFVYLFARIRIGSRLPFWKTLGWRSVPPVRNSRATAYVLFVLGGMVLAALVQMGSALAPPEKPLPIQEFFQSKETILLLTGMAILMAPLVEETIFRGYLYPVMARSLGIRGGVLLTGTLFGLAHAAQLWGGWLQIVLLVVVGIAFTAVRAWARSVVACYFAHLGYNSMLFAYFYTVTDGLQRLPSGR